MVTKTIIANEVRFEATKSTEKLIAQALKVKIENKYELSLYDAYTLIDPMVLHPEQSFQMLRIIFNIGFLQGQKQMRAHSKKILAKMQ